MFYKSIIHVLQDCNRATDCWLNVDMNMVDTFFQNELDEWLISNVKKDPQNWAL